MPEGSEPEAMEAEVKAGGDAEVEAKGHLRTWKNTRVTHFQVRRVAFLLAQPVEQIRANL